jgi:hypothetical protein
LRVPSTIISRTCSGFDANCSRRSRIGSRKAFSALNSFYLTSTSLTVPLR